MNPQHNTPASSYFVGRCSHTQIQKQRTGCPFERPVLCLSVCNAIPRFCPVTTNL